MVQRRSRMHRTPIGTHIALTPRDFEIFRVLTRYRYLRSTYLHAFAGGASETRFKERLCVLFHEGYLDRPSQQWQFADALHAPVVYELGEGAKRILHERGDTSDPWTFLSPGAHRQFAHSVMLCACLASIELATRDRDSLRFIPWPEILTRVPEATRASPVPFRIPLSCGGIVPDGFFGIEYGGCDKKAYRFFALEADHGTMPVIRSDKRQTSFFGKLSAYHDAITQRAHKHHLGVPNLFVLTVTNSKTRLSEMVRTFSDHSPRPTFLFKALDGALVVPVLDLFNTPWERPNLPPLPMDRP
ncbi:MAG: replication-relaxation family protein [Rhizomicrobium sp.]